MADWKKLAQGRKAFTKPAEEKTKPARKLEQTSAEELGEAETAFRDRITKEDKRRKLATDSEFWFAVHFSSREEKERFLRKYGLDRIGDKYLSGTAVDRVLQARGTKAKDGHRERR